MGAKRCQEMKIATRLHDHGSITQAMPRTRLGRRSFAGLFGNENCHQLKMKKWMRECREVCNSLWKPQIMSYIMKVQTQGPCSFELHFNRPLLLCNGDSGDESKSWRDVAKPPQQNGKVQQASALRHAPSELQSFAFYTKGGRLAGSGSPASPHEQLRGPG